MIMTAKRTAALLVAAMFFVLVSSMFSNIPFSSLLLNSHGSSNPLRIPQPGFTGVDQLGIDCGLGTTQAVLNSTGFPVAPSEVGQWELANRCTWIGDAGQTATLANDGTNEPLVNDQDESLSLTSSHIGGGFTANIVLAQNASSTVDGFDLQVKWNPAVLHAVEFDQGGLPWKSTVLFTPIQTIDNVHGVAELAQVISSTVGLNVTLFRMRFDVIGVGITSLNVVDGPGGGLTNPGFVIHKIVASSFDSETVFDATHSLNWEANVTAPSPLTPGAQNTFSASVLCPGCTGPFSYQWQFNSTSTGPFRQEATGNPITVTLPNTNFLGLRMIVIVKDSATPTPHNITLTRDLPLTVSVQGSTSVAVGATASWTGYWLGGSPSYTAKWRLCPGTAIVKTVCSNPVPGFSSSTQNSSLTSAIYNFAGEYNATLSITDTVSPVTSTATTSTGSILLNVTGAPPAFTVAVTANPSLPIPGSSVT